MSRADYLSAFPEEIVTTCGVLKLTTSKTSWTRSDGVAAVITTCNYRQLISDSGVIFDPDLTLPPDPNRWREIFDRRYRHCSEHWRNFLGTQLPRITERVVDWLPEGTSFEDFWASLTLDFVRISEDESVVLGFGNLPILAHHDFAITIDSKDSIQEVIIEG